MNIVQETQIFFQTALSVKAKELVERSDSRPDLDPTENLWDKLKRRSELFETI
jgi:hypothetical protein